MFKTMVDAVLVEFEGVVGDTAGARSTALRESLRDDGIVLSDNQYEDCCAYLPVRSAARAAFALAGRVSDETGIELAAVRAERRFSSLTQTGMSLVPGARELIESIQVQGRRLAIVTRSARTDVERVLELGGLDHAFEFLIADDDVYAPKPSPAPYIAALERLARRRAVSSRNVVALEDSPAGIRSAKSAGLRCAAVGAMPVHLAVDADALVPSLASLSVASLDALTLGTRVAER